MIARLLTVTLLAVLVCSCRDTALAQNAPEPTPATQQSQYMSGYTEGPVPSMDSKRTVNEQDCTKPIDLKAGNLRCK